MPEPSESDPANRESSHTRDLDQRLAVVLYRFRWPASLLMLGVVLLAFAAGVSRVSRFSSDVASLADTSNGSGAVKPLAFDPSMDIWFGEHDEAVTTYYGIEDTFVAEDFVMVTFEVPDSEWGVFDPAALSTIARLTNRFLTIPGVRHVRSLTYNPWIRWGTIEDSAGDEDGLIISDLVEGDPRELSENQIVERMIAVLGASKTAERIGEARVRRIIGAEASFDDHLGEPLLLGTIISDSGNTTAIQVQVLRPRVDTESVVELFEDDGARRAGTNLSSIERQRAAVRGIEHFLRLEKGLAVPTSDYPRLQTWIEGLPLGEERTALQLELENPTRNFMEDSKGVLIRKYFEYDPEGVEFVDRSEPSEVVVAASDFSPAPKSPFHYHLGGVPLFERNFEIVGLADGKFVPLMFLVIAILLFAVFRNLAGIVVPFAVVFGSVMAMIGIAFWSGDLLNNLTMLSPNMLTAVGIADAIHLVAAWALLRGEYDDKRSLITEVVRRNALPVFLTSITTAVGFYSLTASSIQPVGMLGSMAALGTFFAWALSMTAIPALLSIFPHRKITASSRLATAFSAERSARFVDFVLYRRRGVLVVAVVIFAVSVFGLSQVKIDSDFRSMFPDDNPVMSDFVWIEERLGGVGDLELVFAGASRVGARVLTEGEEGRLIALAVQASGSERVPAEFDPLTAEEAREFEKLRRMQADWDQARIGVSTEFLTALDAFETRLREEMANPSSPLTVLTDFISPLDTLRKIHQVQHRNRAEFYRVPMESDVPDELRQSTLEYDEWTDEWSLTPAQSGRTLAAQYYLQYESGARPGESLATQLSSDRTQFRVQGRVKQAGAAEHLAAFARIEEIARTEFPLLVAGAPDRGPDASGSESEFRAGQASFTISGKSLLFARTSDLFAKGFIYSMSIALSVITILIGVIFRSWRLALISLIPNVLPIILPLSVFGLLGIPLDGPSILVSSVALGVCVDDTIHFFTKFMRARKRGETARNSLVYSLSQAGAAMTITTVVLIIGFGTLLLSDFAPNFQMGALAALMIGLAWIADFVVTAAVLSFSSDAKVESLAAEPVAVT